MTLCSGVNISGWDCLRFFRWKAPSECLSTQRICCGVTSHVRKASNARSSEHRSFCRPEYWTMCIGCEKRSNQDRVVSLMFFNIWVTDDVRPARKEFTFNFIDMQLTALVLKSEYARRTPSWLLLLNTWLHTGHVSGNTCNRYLISTVWSVNVQHYMISILPFNAKLFLHYHILITPSDWFILCNIANLNLSSFSYGATPHPSPVLVQLLACTCAPVDKLSTSWVRGQEGPVLTSTNL